MLFGVLLQLSKVCQQLAGAKATAGAEIRYLANVGSRTSLRWVVRYTEGFVEEFVRRWEPFELVVGRSWRADERVHSEVE